MTALRFLGNLLLAALLILLIASTLFAAWAVVASRTWENAGLDDGVEEGTWAWIDQQPIYYQTWGPERGPCVVLVHGRYVEGSKTWEATARVLARSGMWVIAPDLKGFGHSVRDTSPTYSVRSQADLLAKLLNQLQIRGATIVAHDRGSAVALQLAYEQPQFVGRLALIAPLVYGEQTPIWQPVAQVPYLGPAVRPAAAWTVDSGGPLWAVLRRRSFHDESAATDAYLAEMRRPTHIVGTLQALLAMADSPPDSDLPGVIPNIEVPVLILVGNGDPLVTVEEGNRLKDDLGSARLVVVPEAGHYPHVEQSLEVNHHLAEFCAEGSP